MNSPTKTNSPLSEEQVQIHLREEQNAALNALFPASMRQAQASTQSRAQSRKQTQNNTPIIQQQVRPATQPMAQTKPVKVRDPNKITFEREDIFGKNWEGRPLGNAIVLSLLDYIDPSSGKFHPEAIPKIEDKQLIWAYIHYIWSTNQNHPVFSRMKKTPSSTHANARKFVETVILYLEALNLIRAADYILAPQNLDNMHLCTFVNGVIDNIPITIGDQDVQTKEGEEPVKVPIISELLAFTLKFLQQDTPSNEHAFGTLLNSQQPRQELIETTVVKKNTGQVLNTQVHEKQPHDSITILV